MSRKIHKKLCCHWCINLRMLWLFSATSQDGGLYGLDIGFNRCLDFGHLWCWSLQTCGLPTGIWLWSGAGQTTTASVVPQRTRAPWLAQHLCVCFASLWARQPGSPAERPPADGFVSTVGRYTLSCPSSAAIWKQKRVERAEGGGKTGSLIGSLSSRSRLFKQAERILALCYLEILGAETAKSSILVRNDNKIFS